mgnify:CR=1
MVSHECTVFIGLVERQASHFGLSSWGTHVSFVLERMEDSNTRDRFCVGSKIHRFFDRIGSVSNTNMVSAG